MSTNKAHSPRTDRARAFSKREHYRYWWHQTADRSYTPPIYSDISDDEWSTIEDWFQETEARDAIGEMAIPMISVLQGFIMGSSIRSVVQLGHYMGYSTMLLGFMLRRIGPPAHLVSIDIDPKATDFTQGWVDRAGLRPFVSLLVGDSAEPEMPTAAAEALGRDPQCVIIDSSHQYAHTLRELELWWHALAPGGLLFLHDSSEYACQWDSTGEGGVRRAILEWLPSHPNAAAIMLNGDPRTDQMFAYADGCGLCIVQKSLPTPTGPTPD